MVGNRIARVITLVFFLVLSSCASVVTVDSFDADGHKLNSFRVSSVVYVDRAFMPRVTTHGNYEVIFIQ